MLKVYFSPYPMQWETLGLVSTLARSDHRISCTLLAEWAVTWWIDPTVCVVTHISGNHIKLLYIYYIYLQNMYTTFLSNRSLVGAAQHVVGYQCPRFSRNFVYSGARQEGAL